MFTLLFLIVAIIPFVIGVNDTFVNETEFNSSQYVVGVPGLSSNSTTNFDDFLEKDVGIYYKEIGNETQDNNKSNTFTTNPGLVVIDDDNSDMSSIYVPIDEFTTNPNTTTTNYIVVEDEALAVVQDGDVEIIFGVRNQEALVEGENVRWTQYITLDNAGEPREITLNLWSHDAILNRSFLWDVVKSEISVADNVISQTPIALVKLAKGELKTIRIDFETPVVAFTTTCQDMTVLDLLPADAVVIETTIELDTIVDTFCTSTIEYPSGLRYKNVKVV